MVAFRWCAAVLLAVTLSSCDILFQSYFPTQVEFQEQQIDLSAELGKTIASVNLGYLMKTPVHPQNLLVASVLTIDGEISVLFYDADSLSLIRRYSGSDLAGQNGGSMPQLRLFGQDDDGVYVGDMQFTSAQLQVSSGGFLPQFFTSNPSTDPNQVRTTWDPFTSSGFLWATQGLNLLYWSASGAGAYQQLGNVLSKSLVLSGYSTKLLDALQDGSDSFAIVADGGNILLFEGPDPPLWTGPTATLSNNYLSDGGWATSSAAIVEGHADNAKELTAVSWTGDVLGKLTLPDNRQTFALAFSPAGQWYLYQSSTGKLSRNRPWWEKP